MGRDDADLRVARARLGSRALIGVSAYADLARAREAVALGADYVAFGRFFPSVTRPSPPAPVAVLRAARRHAGAGGRYRRDITPENAAV